MNELFDIIKAGEIRGRTINAYMYKTYGQDEWVKCILFLYDKGFTANQIEEILRSKHMRWANDNEREWETASETFINYYSCNSNGIKGDIEKWMNCI